MFFDTSEYVENDTIIHRYTDTTGTPRQRYLVLFEDSERYAVYETNVSLALLQEYIDADGVILGHTI